MVEILEKCLVIGVGLVLASTLFPIQYDVIEDAGKRVVQDSYRLYAKEIDEAVWRTNDLGQDSSIDIVLPQNTYISYTDNVLKIVIAGEEFHVGKYPFNVIVHDIRNHYGKALITLSKQDGYILIVIEDAE
ncbi:MAG: hypothetical protein ACUVQ8_01045 [Nitrososphaeria archaeon]